MASLTDLPIEIILIIISFLNTNYWEELDFVTVLSQTKKYSGIQLLKWKSF